ncbi:hypothetical protein ACJX0J_014223 [Zea mays]
MKICFINYSLALFMNCWRFVLKLVLAHQKQQNKCAFSWRPALLLHFLMFNENLQILFLIDEIYIHQIYTGFLVLRNKKNILFGFFWYWTHFKSMVFLLNKHCHFQTIHTHIHGSCNAAAAAVINVPSILYYETL